MGTMFLVTILTHQVRIEIINLRTIKLVVNDNIKRYKMSLYSTSSLL